MTPLRALSAQTEVTLQRTFQPFGKTVSSLYGAIGVSDADQDLLRDSDMIVATPEKLDFALRNDPGLLDDVGLVVLDEGHMIGLTEREVRYEVQIQRLLRRSDAAGRRVVCLSAILPDGSQLEDFTAWLTGDGRQGILRQDRTPTRRRYGEVTWKGDHGRLDLSIGDEHSWVEHFLRSRLPRGRRTRQFPADQRELCIATAWALVEEGQSVLVFCPMRRSVEPFARSIVDLAGRGVLRPVLKGPASALADALAIGAEWLGADHPVLRCLRLGVAIHHGALPTPFRKELERLLRQGALNVTISSPTLAQGLNLSATALLFHGLTRNGEQIDSAEFRNVIGRAGRAYVDVEGVVLLPMFDSGAAKAEVAEGMRVGARAVDLIDLACTFEVPFDDAPLVAHLRLRELSGRLEPAELAAELQLHRRRDGPAQFAEFLLQRGQALKEVTTPGGYAALLARALGEAGRLDEAETAVRQSQADLGVDADRFQDMFAAARGDDVLPALEERYAATGNLLDLMAVVDRLGGRDPEKAAGYSAELFRLQRSAIHARRTASALMSLDRHAGALEFLEGCPDLVEADLDLTELKAHALYRAGRYKEAGALTARLVSARDSANCVAIEVNVAIARGDWEHLPAILDREYPKHESREAGFLLRLASICAQMDPVRAAEMAATAARKEPDNPQILAAAGLLAVQLGRESTGFPLIAAAGRLSSDTGPVRSVGLEDAAVVYGDVVAQQRETEARLARAELPLAFACANLNTSVTQVLVNQGRRNAVLHDWRQRAVVPFRHGGRPLVDISAARTVAADYTALLVLADLDLLPRLGERFEHIVVPWSTAELLMVEARQARFHQPSQVQAARRLRRHLTAVPPRIGVTAAQATAPPSLRAAVGEELASLLVSAAASGGRVLLASRSAIPQEAWEKLRNSGYDRLFASFADLLDAIRSQGAADSSVLEGAVSFLSQAGGGNAARGQRTSDRPALPGSDGDRLPDRGRAPRLASAGRPRRLRQRGGRCAGVGARADRRGDGGRTAGHQHASGVVCRRAGQRAGQRRSPPRTPRHPPSRLPRSCNSPRLRSPKRRS